MTAEDLIHQALRAIGVIPSGVSASTEEKNDGLLALNQLLANWSAHQVAIPNLTRRQVALNGAASYNLVTRPLRIKAAMWLHAGVEVGYEIVSAEVFADGRRSRVLYHDGGFATGVIRLRPSPSGGTLELDQFEPLGSLGALNTTVNLPPGYERALKFALAKDLAGEYGRPLPPEVAAGAEEAVQAIVSLNRQVLGEMPPPAPEAAA